jgi:hypothetical protein
MPPKDATDSREGRLRAAPEVDDAMLIKASVDSGLFHRTSPHVIAWRRRLPVHKRRLFHCIGALKNRRLVSDIWILNGRFKSGSRKAQGWFRIGFKRRPLG